MRDRRASQAGGLAGAVFALGVVALTPSMCVLCANRRTSQHVMPYRRRHARGRVEDDWNCRLGLGLSEAEPEISIHQNALTVGIRNTPRREHRS
jgi:hypothetical protein